MTGAAYVLSLATMPPLSWSGPEITGAGDEHSAINGETPNLSVRIDNARGQHTAALAAAAPLRVRAVLRLAGAVMFEGSVQSVRIADEITIDIEA